MTVARLRRELCHHNPVRPRACRRQPAPFRQGGGGAVVEQLVVISAGPPPACGLPKSGMEIVFRHAEIGRTFGSSSVGEGIRSPSMDSLAPHLREARGFGRFVGSQSHGTIPQSIDYFPSGTIVERCAEQPHMTEGLTYSQATWRTRSGCLYVVPPDRPQRSCSPFVSFRCRAAGQGAQGDQFRSKVRPFC